MAKVYKYPPITEAVCEFRFAPSQPWDSTFFGLVYDKLKHDFPKKRQEVGFKFEVGQQPAEAAPPQIISAPPKMKFLSDDERSLIQLQGDVLSVNKMKPYERWETFKALILHSLSAYTAVNNPKGIRRIGIRYINRIEIPESEVKIEDYLQAVPGLPEEIPQVFNTWVQRVEVPFPKINGLLILQSGSIREKDVDGVAFLLDLDFLIAAPEQPILLSSAEEMIETGHREVENAFEACITDKTRSIFDKQGENKNG
jgi:uncharacterized protein (TIGR04255 family)